MATLFVMCGLPGSGKSYTAALISEEIGAVIVSSDAVRGRLYGDEGVQGDPREVFAEVDREIDHLCALGEDVILDATSISVWSRRNALKRHTKFDRYVCVYVNTDMKVCLERNAKRDRHVPEDVIKGMSKKFETPSKKEGFNKVITL